MITPLYHPYSTPEEVIVSTPIFLLPCTNLSYYNSQLTNLHHFIISSFHLHSPSLLSIPLCGSSLHFSSRFMICIQCVERGRRGGMALGHLPLPGSDSGCHHMQRVSFLLLFLILFLLVHRFPHYSHTNQRYQRSQPPLQSSFPPLPRVTCIAAFSMLTRHRSSSLCQGIEQKKNRSRCNLAMTLSNLQLSNVTPSRSIFPSFLHCSPIF